MTDVVEVTAERAVTVEVITAGPQGPQGEQGADGEDGTGGTGGGVGESVADGTYAVASLTVASRIITAIEAGEDVASESTQQEILAAVNTLSGGVGDLADGGVTAPDLAQETF